jgi:hypothetical protein
MDQMKPQLEIKEEYQLSYARMRHTKCLSISQIMSTKKQFEYLIETMQLCHFTDEQWNNLKAILIDHRDRFTDDQWKTVFHLLSLKIG